MLRYLRMLTVMALAGTLGLFWSPVAEAQTAKKLNCGGCVKSKQLKNNGVRSKDIKNGAVTVKKLSTKLSGILAGARQPILVDSTGKEIGHNLGRSEVLMESDVDGTLFFVVAQRLGFNGSDEIRFTGPDCTGQAYSGEEGNLDEEGFSDRALFFASVWDNKAYLLQDPDLFLKNVAVMSRAFLEIEDGASTCSTENDILSVARQLILVKDLSGFTPPFSAKW